VLNSIPLPIIDQIFLTLQQQARHTRTDLGLRKPLARHSEQQSACCGVMRSRGWRLAGHRSSVPEGCTFFGIGGTCAPLWQATYLHLRTRSTFRAGGFFLPASTLTHKNTCPRWEAAALPTLTSQAQRYRQQKQQPSEPIDAFGATIY